jgi:predicted RNA-binding protein
VKPQAIVRHAIFLLVLATVVTRGVQGQAAPAQAAAPAPEPAQEAPPPTQRSLENIPGLPQPSGKISVVGGTVRRIDLVHDQIILRVPGGRRDAKIAFDTRTVVLNSNHPGDFKLVRPGVAVSIDTMTDRDGLFAKTIRVNDAVSPRELRGQVVSYDASRQRITVRNELDSSQMQVSLAARTTFLQNGQESKTAPIRAGDLVRITLTDAQGPRNTADQIEILAEPGHFYTFAGSLLSIDLRTHTIAITNKDDATMHEISIDQVDAETVRKLQEGAEVEVNARFDGTRYSARTVKISAHPE